MIRHLIISLVIAVPNFALAQWVTPPAKSQLESNSGLHHRTFDSKAMKTKVGFCVSLPKDYEAGKSNHPVVYWLHGGGGNESCNLFVAQAWRNKDADSKEVARPIVVFPAAFRSGYMDHHDGTIMIESMIIKELIPLIDKDYRTISDRTGRAVHGFSMGSSGALKFATKYPEMFCSAVAWGGGAINIETTQNKWLLDILQRNLNGDTALLRANNTYHFVERNKQQLLKHKTPFLLICGKEDSWHKSAIDFHKHLQDQGMKSELMLLDGLNHNITKLHQKYGDEAIRFQQTVFQKQANRTAATLHSRFGFAPQLYLASE